jgi:ring-1,2-phenylacetyl-CoA epoxidase subunit PaaD
VVDRRHRPEGRKLRCRLRAACAAAARRAPLVELQRHLPLPYCGSTETRLDNLFGPTPCRSIRYCTACRQPFEQFKTI